MRHFSVLFWLFRINCEIFSRNSHWNRVILYENGIIFDFENRLARCAVICEKQKKLIQCEFAIQFCQRSYCIVCNPFCYVQFHFRFELVFIFLRRERNACIVDLSHLLLMILYIACPHLRCCVHSIPIYVHDHECNRSLSFALPLPSFNLCTFVSHCFHV